MKVLAVSTLALALLSVEAVLEKSLGLEVARFDAGVALVVYMALRGRTLEGAFSAFAVGYLLDVFTGRPTGLYPFLAVLVFLLVRFVAQLLDGRSRLAYGIFTAAAAAGHGLLAFFFTWLTSRAGGEHQLLSLAGLPVQVSLTALVAVLLWPLLRRLEPGERPEPGVLR
jgi:rod shape-determining protein MreD